MLIGQIDLLRLLVRTDFDSTCRAGGTEASSCAETSPGLGRQCAGLGGGPQSKSSLVLGQLDLGESEAIALAAEVDADVVLMGRAGGAAGSSSPGPEGTRRSERLLDRRRKQAAFRDPHKTLDNFDFTFNPKMNRSLVFDLATCAFISKREDALFLGPGGTGKSHLAQAIGQAAIQQNYRVDLSRRMSCWRNSPRLSWKGNASSSWSRWPRCRS